MSTEPRMVLLEEDLEALDKDALKAWKGYRYRLSFDVVTEASAADGDTAETGWENEESEVFFSLEELLREHQVRSKSWLEWSDGKPCGTSWVLSQEETDSHKGDVTTYHLFIKRVDGKGLRKEELDHIAGALRL